jgi:hypothetical protein
MNRKSSSPTFIAVYFFCTHFTSKRCFQNEHFVSLDMWSRPQFTQRGGWGHGLPPGVAARGGLALG